MDSIVDYYVVCGTAHDGLSPLSWRYGTERINLTCRSSVLQFLVRQTGKWADRTGLPCFPMHNIGRGTCVVHRNL